MNKMKFKNRLDLITSSYSPFLPPLPHVTNVCYLGPSLHLRKLFSRLLIFSVDDLKWFIELNIFISSHKKILIVI